MSFPVVFRVDSASIAAGSSPQNGGESHEQRGAAFRRLQNGVQIIRHRGDSRRPGAGAVELYGRGSADLSLHHVQTGGARKARGKWPDPDRATVLADVG